MKICFLSPRDFTGGPMAIHQAAATVNSLGANASIMYVRSSGISIAQKNDSIITKLNYFSHLIIDKRLKEYGVPTSKEISKDTLFIVPEIMPHLATSLIRLGCRHVCIWWLSVDNFPLSSLNTLATQALINSCTHLCQSVYAKNFVTSQGGADIHMLTDFTKVIKTTSDSVPRRRDFDLAYLPSKAHGAEEIVAQLKKHLNVVALQNMSRAEITGALMRSKIFLDFGHHPGKDRVPREAAICGAVPLVRKVGAAAITDDVPLPTELLIESKHFFDIDRLIDRITLTLENLQKWENELTEYRNWIQSEESRFKIEIENLISLSEKHGD